MTAAENLDAGIDDTASGSVGIHDFQYIMETRGWYRFPGVLPADQLAALRDDLDRLYRQCREVQVRNGVAANMEGTAHHLVGSDSSVDELINHLPLHDFISAYFDGKFIATTISASLNPPASKSYVMKVHRDVRAFTRTYRLMLNMLVMLDDFTDISGPTMMLPGSHHVEAPPSAEVFEAMARPVRGRAGDIVLFNSLVFHRASVNRGDQWRRGLTICFGRPWMKPQMDFPRFVPAEQAAKLTPIGRQLLGYNAKVATSLDEYYQPPENWAFKPDQF